MRIVRNQEGLCSTYSTTARKWRSSRIARSKYSGIQKRPRRPRCRLASLAVNDFHECTTEVSVRPASGVATTCTWLGITHQAWRR